MFSIVITERGGAQRHVDFEAAELRVGRVEGNDIVLPRSNVSKHHARLEYADDHSVLTDLDSTNGTYLNGRKISSPVNVAAGDKIYIGDYVLTLQQATASAPVDRAKRDPLPVPPAVQRRAIPARAETIPFSSSGVPTPAAGGSPESDAEPTALSASPLIQDTVPAAAPPPTPTQPPLRGPLTANDHRSDEQPGLRQSPPGTRSLDPPPGRGHGSVSPRLSDGAPRVSNGPLRMEDPESGQGPQTSPAVLAPSVRLQGALQTLMERLGAHMDLGDPTERAFPAAHQHTLESLIDSLATEGLIGPDLDRRFLQQAAISEAVGLGPLDRLLNNRAVREVVVDSPSRILADLGGGLSPVSSFFSSSRAVQVVLRRLCTRAGRELSDDSIQQVQLPDGSQLQVLMPPLSPTGPLLSIRCPARSATSADALVTEGVLSVDMLALLRAAVQRRLNLLVVGPMATGVSTLLGAIASLASDHERLVTLQHSPSLSIQHPHVLPLNLAGAQGTTLTELLRHAARLRADRLVIDDLHGEDALGALIGAAAMRGVLVGMHAPSPAAALEQLELFAQVALGGARASLAALVAQAFQLLVHVSVDATGARRVQSITEVRGARDNTLDVAALFRYDGGFKPTDQRPMFLGL